MKEFDLRDLALFAAIAQHRNFRRAARELSLSVSTLSERLREFESLAGVRLLNRTTRSVAPTEAGEQLLGRISQPLKDLRAAAAELGALSGEVSGLLRINSPPPATHLVLAPLVAPFLARYPKVSLEIVDEPLLVDIVAAGFDAGVRYEESLAKDVVAVSLGPRQRYCVVASPALIEARGAPRTPRDLLGAPCILSRFRGHAPLAWEFERHGKSLRITPQARFLSLNIGAQLRAAIDGLGFLATFEGYVQEAVGRGTLVPVLTDWMLEFEGPFLYYPSRHQNRPVLDAFVAFVREWRGRDMPRREKRSRAL
jgi:DNA-binding transcriptional LysR family regulator